MKNIFHTLFNFYILLNFHVALSVVSIYMIFNNIVDNNYVLFLFFSTIFSYTGIRLLSYGSNRFFIKKFLARHKNTVIAIVISTAILSFYFFTQLTVKQQITLIPFIFLTVFYNYDYKYAPFPKLRNNGVIKIIIVAFTWSGLTILVSNIENLDAYHLYELAFVFVYILMLTLSFDQRDILVDKGNITTIPHHFKKLNILYFLLVFILSVLLFLVFDNQYNKLIISVFIVLLSAYLCIRSNTQKNFYYTAFWIEGIPIFWFISQFLVK